MTHPGSHGALSWAGGRDTARGPGLSSHGPIYLLLPKLGFSCIRIKPGVESWDLGKADVKTEVWSSLGAGNSGRIYAGHEVREFCSGQPSDFNIENSK